MLKKSKKISIFDFCFNLLLSVCPEGLTIEELSRQVSISEQTDNDIPVILVCLYLKYIDNTMICGFRLLLNTNLGWDIEERKHCS